jgi:hypothetical protein
MILRDSQAAREAVLMETVSRSRTTVADPPRILDPFQELLGTDGGRVVEWVRVCEAALHEGRVWLVYWIESHEDGSECFLGNVLENVHVVCYTDLVRSGGHGGFGNVVAGRPSSPGFGH